MITPPRPPPFSTPTKMTLGNRKRLVNLFYVQCWKQSIKKEIFTLSFKEHKILYISDDPLPLFYGYTWVGSISIGSSTPTKSITTFTKFKPRSTFYFFFFFNLYFLCLVTIIVWRFLSLHSRKPWKIKIIYKKENGGNKSNIQLLSISRLGDPVNRQRKVELEQP